MTTTKIYLVLALWICLVPRSAEARRGDRLLAQAMHEPRLLKEATAALVQVGSREAMRAVEDRYVAATAEERLAIVEQLEDEANPWSRKLLASATQSRDVKLATVAGRILLRQQGVEESPPEGDPHSELQWTTARLQQADALFQRLRLQ